MYNELVDFEIRKLAVDDASILSTALSKDSSDYNKYLVAFDFDEETIKQKLDSLNKDVFFGLFVQNQLAGFYMLRGFDEGYNIPSYGVWISSKYKNKGLAKLTLNHAISICKLSGVKKIMLKVHPDHYIKKVYEECGFTNTGVDEKIGHLIYHLSLDN